MIVLYDAKSVIDLQQLHTQYYLDVERAEELCGLA